MPLKLNTASSGSVTLDAANTASNFTITVPATTATMATVDGSGNMSVTGNLSFNSGYGSSAVAYGCRAWVNFNGTGTVAIIASGNVSSITDNGTGDYTVNFTTAMVDTNYSFVTNSSNTTNANILCIAQLNWDNPTKTTSALRIYNLKSNTGALTDQNTISVAVFR